MTDFTETPFTRQFKKDCEELRARREPGAYLADGTKIRPRANLHPFYDQPECDEPAAAVSTPRKL